MDILRIFAYNVKNYRLAYGYSQEKLAEYAGLHRTYISAVERCRRSIALENVQKIANALHIEPYLLFMEIPNEKDKA
jgi:transcriptional regulator with XRE-family HTH domain